jgi:hypothetical protein
VIVALAARPRQTRGIFRDSIKVLSRDDVIDVKDQIRDARFRNTAVLAAPFRSFPDKLADLMVHG